MSAKEIINQSGTTPATSAYAYARQYGSIALPKGLYFDPNDDGGNSDNDDGAGNDDNSDDQNSDSDDQDDESSVIPKSQHDAVLKDMIKFRKQAKDTGKQLKELQGRIPSQDEMDEFRNFRVKQQKAEEEEAKKAGQHEKLIEKMRKEHEDKISELSSKLNEQIVGRRQDSINNLLSKNIPQHTTVPVDDVAPLIAPYFKFDDDGELIIEVNGEEPLNSSTGKPKTPQEFIESYIDERPHLAAHRPKGGSGGKNGKGKGSGKGGVLTVEEFERMSQKDFEENEAAIMQQIEGR